MPQSKQAIAEAFGNKLRIRVSGVCLLDDQILMVCHKSIGEKGELWAPPGGGMNFGESAIETLKREFLEETNLEIEVGNLLFVNEYLETPLHCVELFFEVTVINGVLNKGIDPELESNEQIIKAVQFILWENLAKFDPLTVHSAFRNCSSIKDVLLNKGKYLINKVN